MLSKILAPDQTIEAFHCARPVTGTAFLMALIIGLAGCSSPKDFVTKGEPELSLKRIEILSTSKQNLDEGIDAFKTGKMPEAKALFKKALKDSLSNKEYKIAYDCYMAIGRCDEVQENLDEAESYFRQTLAFAEKHFANNKSKISDAVAALGQVLTKKGNYKGGEKLLRKAVDMRIAQENWLMAIDHALKLKWFYEKTKQPTKQMANMEELIKLQKLATPDDHLLIARLYLEKGQKERDLKRNEAAAESFKTTHEELKKTKADLSSGPLYVEYAAVLKEIGKISESDHAILIAEKIAKDAPDSVPRAALKEKLSEFRQGNPLREVKSGSNEQTLKTFNKAGQTGSASKE